MSILRPPNIDEAIQDVLWIEAEQQCINCRWDEASEVLEGVIMGVRRLFWDRRGHV